MLKHRRAGLPGRGFSANGDEPRGVCPPLSPKATKSLGDGDFPFLLWQDRKGIPPNPPLSAPAWEPGRSAGRFEMRLWHCPYCEPAGAFLFSFFFFFFFLIIFQMSPPSAGTISRLCVFITFFTLRYSLLPIPLLL